VPGDALAGRSLWRRIDGVGHGPQRGPPRNADLSHLPSNTLLDHLAEVPPIPKQSGHPIRPKAPALLMGEAGSVFGNLNRARSFLRFGSPLQRRQGRIIGAPENMAAAWSRRPLWAAKRSSF
jgi:hypothetical protein